MKKLVLLIGLLTALGIHCFAQEPRDSLYRAFVDGKYQAVIDKSAELLGQFPNDIQLLLLQAHAFKQLKAYNNAITSLNQTLSIDSTNAQALELLADCYSLLGKHSKALTFNHQLYLLDTTSNIQALRLATSYKAASHLPEAMGIFERLAANDTTNTLYLKYLGDCYSHMDDLAIAIAYYKHAYTINPQDVNMLVVLLKAYYKHGKYSDAVAAAKEGLNVDSTSCEVLKMLGLSAIQLNHYNQAAIALQKAYTLGDSTTTTTRYLGISHLKNSSLDKGLHYLKKVYEKGDSLNVETLFYYSLALSGKAEWDEAKKLLDKAMELIQPNPAFVSLVHEQTGFVFRNTSKLSDAYKAYQKAYEVNPNKKSLVYSMADLQKDMGNFQKALDLYNKYLLLNNITEDSGDEDLDSMLIRHAKVQIKKLKQQLGIADEGGIKPDAQATTSE